MSWSYSMLMCWEKCAAQYNYRFNLHMKEEVTGAAMRGTHHHGRIEAYLKGEPGPLLPSFQPAFTLLDRLKDGKVSVEQKIGLNDKWEPVPWGEAWYRCVLDAVEAPEDGTLPVWEWKTGRHWPEHEDQRLLYGLAGLSVFPSDQVAKVQVNGYYLDDHTMDVTVLDREAAKEVKKEFEMRQAIMASDKTYAARPGIYCRWCAYARSKGGPCRFS